MKNLIKIKGKQIALLTGIGNPLIITIATMLFVGFTMFVQANKTFASSGLPNFVIIFIDDMGYGDIEPFGSKINETPQLSRMAEEGMCLTSFYSAAPVCTPLRAALMTGCYPKRVGLAKGSWSSVLFPMLFCPPPAQCTQEIYGQSRRRTQY